MSKTLGFQWLMVALMAFGSLNAGCTASTPGR
jgi:hypothetical protein